MTVSTSSPLRPMLAHPAKNHMDLSEYTKGEHVMEPKLDGWRWLVVHDAAGQLRCFGGRNGAEHTGKARDIELLLHGKLPKNTIIDGELLTTVPGVAVSTALAREPQLLYLAVFDLLRWNGNDMTGMTLSIRRGRLDGIDWGTSGLVDETPQMQVNEDVYKTWLGMGMEGAVVKRLSSLYHPGKRSHDWIKFKPQETAEAVVVGFELGKGESNTDKIGCFRVRMLLDNGALGPETSCSLGTHSNRDEATRELKRVSKLTPPELPDWFGRVIEMRHHGLFDTGVPRHPVWSRWRPDRDELRISPQLGEVVAERLVAASRTADLAD